MPFRVDVQSPISEVMNDSVCKRSFAAGEESFLDFKDLLREARWLWSN